jgi:hypothetical protein
MKNNCTQPNDQPVAGARPRLGRRSFLGRLGVGAALLTPAASLLSARRAMSQNGPSALTPGDVAILQFLAAAESIERDLWNQYNELASGNPAFRAAQEAIDDEMPQYINDNTDDELSHTTFLNAYLAENGAATVDLSPFRTLPSSHATGALQVGRLTNLMNLTVDTSWWIRYRVRQNPDFGDTFPQFLKIENFPAIPDEDFPVGSDIIQAIANTAAFHFGTIEQGGSSLYCSFVPKASALDMLTILPCIGGTEVFHFAIWHDNAGNVPAVSVPGVTFPDIEEEFEGDPARQKDLIMPEPCKFLERGLPLCSVIRPSSTANAGAVAAVNALTASGLFQGQTQEFFDLINNLAVAADAATRQC